MAMLFRAMAIFCLLCLYDFITLVLAVDKPQAFLRKRRTYRHYWLSLCSY